MMKDTQIKRYPAVLASFSDAGGKKTPRHTKFTLAIQEGSGTSELKTLLMQHLTNRARVKVFLVLEIEE
jgi:hypothetical protein